VMTMRLLSIRLALLSSRPLARSPVPGVDRKRVIALVWLGRWSAIAAPLVEVQPFQIAFRARRPRSSPAHARLRRPRLEGSLWG
jgi:hypothetical protein